MAVEDICAGLRALIAIHTCTGVANSDDVARVAGCHRNTVMKLAERGLAFRAPVTGWWLTDEGRALLERDGVEVVQCVECVAPIEREAFGHRKTEICTRECKAVRDARSGRRARAQGRMCE
jgi:hypothetical protein